MNQLNSHLIKEHRESLLARQFILLIKKGHWPQGTTVPAVHKLAKSFSASSVTVCKALALLHQEGAISRNSGERRFLVGKENPDLPEQLVTESFQYSWKSVVEDLKLKVLTGHYGQGSSIARFSTLFLTEH